MSSEHRKGILWALGSAFCIAAFVIPWKVASTLGSTLVNTLILVLAAAVLNSGLMLYQQRRLPRLRTFDVGLATALAALTLLGNVASANAIVLVSPALMTVVQRSEIIFVALLAWVAVGERVDRTFWVGAAVAAAGLLLLNDPMAGGEVRMNGVLWAAAAALCFSSMAVLTRKFIHRIDTVSTNALRLWLAVALWFIWNGFPAELASVSAAQVGYASLAGFFGPFLGRLFLMTSARFVEARISSLSTLAAPPITLALAYFILADLPSARELQGGAIMLIGIAIPILGLTRTRASGAPSPSRVPDEIG